MGDIAFISFAFTRNDKRRAAYFALFAGALLFYLLGYLIEVLAITPGEAMMALRIENLGIPLIAPFFLLTTMGFFLQKSLRYWMPIVFAIYGIAMFLVVFTNDNHMLYYSSHEMVFNGDFYNSVLGKGPLYVLQQAISISLMLIAYVILAIRYVRGSSILRSQMHFFIIGSLIGFVGNIINITGIAPYGIDIMPIALAVGMIFLAISLYKYKLLDVVSVAFDNAVEIMDDAIIVLDNDWGFIYCNQSAKELFPAIASYSGAENILRMEGWPSELHKETDSQITIDTINQETGEKKYQKAQIDDICDVNNEKIGVSIVIKDITKITNMLEQLEELAITDPLTGIFNRRHFLTLINRQLSLARRYNHSIGLLMLDIDHFKQVNDKYGHVVGDHVLCGVVNAVSEQLRTQDVFARYGGEEFIVFSIENDEKGIVSFAERIRETIETSIIHYEDLKIKVTVSIGAILLSPNQTFDDAVLRVDKALYEAKENGRNRVVLGLQNAENEG